MITILGAGGVIGNELIKLFAAKNQPFRLVGRNPKVTPGATETLAADLTVKSRPSVPSRGPVSCICSLVSGTITNSGRKCGRAS